MYDYFVIYALLVNVVGELYTEKNSCGIARFSCDSTAFLYWKCRLQICLARNSFLIVDCVTCNDVWECFTIGLVATLQLGLYAGRRQFCFTAVVLFSPLNLRGPLADRHQTLPHFRWWHRFIKFDQKFGALKHQNFGAISDNFATWLRISPERHKTSSIWKRHCRLRTLPHRKT